MARIQYIPNRVIDTNGISDGAAVHVYQSDTTTHVTLYADADISVEIPNPMVVPAGAEIPVIYTDYTGDIRLRVVQADGVVSQDEDPYFPVASTNDITMAVPALAREVNPELPISTFMTGHESDIDHTPRFNEAIDKLEAITGQNGGTIRLDDFAYRVASTQAITKGAIMFKGVAMPRVRVNVADAIVQAKGWGTTITLLAGSGDAFTWSNDSGSGYDLGGGGMSDLTIFCDDRSGYAINVNRTIKPIFERVNLWRPDKGIRIYGGIEATLRSFSVDQMRGDRAIHFKGDASNRADALKLYDVFLGCKDATTGNNGTGIYWEGFAHSLQMFGVQAVNPTYGLFCNDGGLSTAQDHMRPHFLRAFGFEVDFATSNCVRLEHFRDFEFHGGYHHSAGTATNFEALEHMVSGDNRNGALRVIGGNFSNGGNFGQVYLNCNDSLLDGCTLQPPSGANENCVFVGENSRKAKVKNCLLGETHVYANPTGTTGVRVAANAVKTSIVGNDFYNCANAIVDSAASGQTFTDANKVW